MYDDSAKGLGEGCGIVLVSRIGMRLTAERGWLAFPQNQKVTQTLTDVGFLHQFFHISKKLGNLSATDRYKPQPTRDRGPQDQDFTDAQAPSPPQDCKQGLHASNGHVLLSSAWLHSCLEEGASGLGDRLRFRLSVKQTKRCLNHDCPCKKKNVWHPLCVGGSSSQTTQRHIRNMGPL